MDIYKIWDSIPDGAKAVVLQVLMVGLYTFVFVFLQTYVENWQYSIALTAGIRAALIAIVKVLEAPKPVTAAKAATKVEGRRLSEYL